jgi:putative flippase GtrA
MRPITRWVRFNLVGVAGFIVQLLTLAAVTRWLGVDPVVAISVAVAVAVSHNFLWHERVTWPGQSRDGRLRRWLAFNLANGLISVATNVALTTLLVAVTEAPLLAANAVAVVLASALNFAVSDRCVFGGARRSPLATAKEHDMRATTFQPARTLVILLTALLGGALWASAQERPQPMAEVAAGALLFADDGVVTEGFLGGTARVYVLPRVSIGPEIAYVLGDNHSHLMLTGNVTVDFVRPIGGEPRPVTPFAVIGGGLFQTREQFPNNETFTSHEGAFTAGLGVRTRVGDRVVAGAEARIGWEAHFRLNGFVGVRLGR